jgi:hypothetical protein
MRYEPTSCKVYVNGALVADEVPGDDPAFDGGNFGAMPTIAESDINTIYMKVVI